MAKAIKSTKKAGGKDEAAGAKPAGKAAAHKATLTVPHQTAGGGAEPKAKASPLANRFGAGPGASGSEVVTLSRVSAPGHAKGPAA